MSLRLIVWPLCMAYVAFLLAGTKGAFSPGIAITAAFLEAMIGFCLWELCSLTEHSVDTAKMSSGGKIARIYR